MRNMFLAGTIFFLISLTGCGGRHEAGDISVMTFNIRYDNPADSINAWPNRIPIICNFLNEVKPDIIGMQEVLVHQYNYLDSVLTDYQSVGIGRSDGVREGEMNPVFFRKDRFDMIRTKTFWLSEDPEVPGSRSWGSSLPRIVTWLEFSDKSNQEHFFFFNTHFAHDSDSARIMSSELLLNKSDSISADFPFIITGDFNMIHSSLGYSILTRPRESVPLLIDTYAVSDKKHTGPAYTFNGFSDKTRAGRIDYIFVRNGMPVREHRTFIRKEHGVYISDHWPVMARVALR